MPPRVAYSLFMLLATGVFLLSRRLFPGASPLAALPWRQRLAILLAAFIGGALGAKLPFALSSGFFSDSAWLADGKTITTGLAGAYLTVELTKWILGIRVKTGDSFALPLALAMAVGRWGCFFNGCCYGAPTSLPWGVYFEVGGRMVRCHPTQLYESLFHLLMAGVLLHIIRQGTFRYQRLKLYLIAYGVYRFATEFIRPEPQVWLGLTFYQLAALALIGGLSIQWAADEHLKLSEVDAGSDRLHVPQPELGSEKRGEVG
jgi:phosphatidylglycerol:prolipoprotein diacylglycerol transferase